ncbi:putative colanic acid biosynthsis UDP-glucose lipid carrier transferase [Hahella chejuensis KCTC 2396]|uniref:Putative colanic acid biosynthsis UDP-glucose lipid carrier transferase n=2 Tax=Hahella chejuensis TaxID=158327 RepID=Q2SD98_HAHCH|nr:putative colanic acid biosynthsis UDP-glucose lipid carrier transferase [Hahella chejuensis KCTC 2396]
MGIFQFSGSKTEPELSSGMSPLIRPQYSKILALFRAIDSLAIHFCLLGTLALFGVTWNESYSWLSIMFVITFGFCAEISQIYYLMRGLTTGKLAWYIVRSWMFALVLISPFAILGLLPNIDLEALAYWAIAVPATLVSLHLLRRIALFSIRRRNVSSKRVGIVGATTLGVRLYDSLSNMPWLGYKLAGFYDDRIDMTDLTRRVTIEEKALCGGFDKLYEDVHSGKVDTIYITLPMCAERRIKDMMDRLADTTVTAYVIPDFFSFNLLYSRLTTIRGIPAISVYDSPLVDHGFAKRMTDIALGLFFIMVTAIPMLIIAAAVKITSPGPVLFKQTRYGIGGGPIKVWKFRSMTVCQDGDNIQQATKNDARLTRIGGFLRRTSLDELPQFFNVLGGSMSIVGPRPHAVAHNEYYRQHIKGYMLRHKVKPGITGLAQVNGFRGETAEMKDMSGRIWYDLEYIRHWSLGMDFKIIFMTVFKGFVGKKAY